MVGLAVAYFGFELEPCTLYSTLHRAGRMPGNDIEKPKLPLVFYRTAGGAEPVRDWLRLLPPADRRAVGLDLLRVQHLWPIGKPLCDHIGGGIWEVRTNLEGNRIARVLFCVIAAEVVTLNGFYKKDSENSSSGNQFS